MEGEKSWNARNTSCYNEPDVKAYNEKLISNGGKGYKELKTL